MESVCLFRNGTFLVPYSSRHDKQTIIWLNDPVFRRDFGLSRPVSAASHSQWIQDQKDLLMWAILDEKMVHQGNISIQLTRRHLSGHFQIYIGNPLARGKKLGWNALVLASHYYFDCLGFHRLWLHTLIENKVAEKIYLKAGFVQEGMERESLFKEGKFHNQLRWSLLKSDWNMMRKEIFK